MHIVIAGLLFLLSGAAGLIYEVVWFRMLATSFGATGPALAATTASFMAGLGFGSAWSARRAARVTRPGLRYGQIEFAIAAFALLMPWLLGVVEQGLDAVAAAGDSGAVRLLLQFVAIFVLLAIPASMMGATLPFLSQAAIRSHETSGRRFAWLYATNTIGAAIGTLATGFWLLSDFGLTGTMRAAVALNVIAGTVAVLIARRPVVDSDEQVEPVSKNIAPRAAEQATIKSPGLEIKYGHEAASSFFQLQWIAFVTGFVSLGSQYLWSRSLIFSFDRLKNTTYSFSTVLAVCLVGIVVGSGIAAIISDRIRNHQRWLMGLCFVLAVSLASSACALLWLPKLHDRIDPASLAVDFPAAVWQAGVRTLIVIGLPTVLSGLILPLIVRAGSERVAVSESIGRLYAANSFGCVAGSITAAFVITPVFGLVKGIFVLALLIGVAAMWRRAHRSRNLATIGVFVAGLLIIRSLPGTWALDTLMPGEHIVRSVDGTMATVSVVENDRGERRISVDDVPVAGTSKIMQTDQKSLAHWGMLLADDPRTALTVGFGSGGASWSFLLHDRLQKLDCAEICPDVPRSADLLTDANHGLLNHSPRAPRYQIILADARAYLRTTTTRYDVIVSDCTDLRYRSSANLYDLQYFQFCREALTDGGCTVIWMPLGGLSREAFLLTLRTFAEVFPEMQVYYLHHRWTHYVLLAGHRQPFALQPARIQALLDEPDVAADLKEIGFTTAEKIAATFLSSATSLTALRESAELNTEEEPRLEFLVPRFDTGPWSAQRNLNLLRRESARIESLLASDISESTRRQFVNAATAAKSILRAQEAERATDVETATIEYLAAQQLTPDDADIAESLRFASLVSAGENGNPTAWLLLGRSLMLQNKHQEAADSMQKYFDSRESLFSRGDSLSETEQQHLNQSDAWAATAATWLSEAKAQMTNDQ